MFKSIELTALTAICYPEGVLCQQNSTVYWVILTNLVRECMMKHYRKEEITQMNVV